MPDHHILGLLRIPFPVLIALSNRLLQFHLQPYHHLIRMAHILSVAVFFGGILLLDLRLIRTRARPGMRDFVASTMPAVHVAFAIAMITGVTLFIYNPVHVGSHAYFTPKLLFIALALLNAAAVHRGGFAAMMSDGPVMPARARIAGWLSLTLWTATMVCACLNTEAGPRVLLR